MFRILADSVLFVHKSCLCLFNISGSMYLSTILSSKANYDSSNTPLNFPIAMSSRIRTVVSVSPMRPLGRPGLCWAHSPSLWGYELLCLRVCTLSINYLLTFLKCGEIDFSPLLTLDMFSLMLSDVPDLILFVIVSSIGVILDRNCSTDFWGLSMFGDSEKAIRISRWANSRNKKLRLRLWTYVSMKGKGKGD